MPLEYVTPHGERSRWALMDYPGVMLTKPLQRAQPQPQPRRARRSEPAAAHAAAPRLLPPLHLAMSLQAQRWQAWS